MAKINRYRIEFTETIKRTVVVYAPNDEIAEDMIYNPKQWKSSIEDYDVDIESITHTGTYDVDPDD